MDIQIVVALIALAASILGGVIVAIVNHLFIRNKTQAEVKKLEAEIDKVKAETKKTLLEAEKISNDTKHALGEANYYDVTQINEEVIYDGTKGVNGYDLKSEFARYQIQHGVVLIQNNEWASYQLQSYIWDGKESSFIPKNELVSGYRRFHVSCELKAINAIYDVAAFLLETPEPEDGSDAGIDDRAITVTDNEWIKTDFYFRTPPDKNYVVYISAERINGDGGLQIRNLVVAERIT